MVFFQDAEFSGGEVSFVNAVFSGGLVSFVNAGFSGGTVDFAALATGRSACISLDRHAAARREASQGRSIQA